MKNSTSSHPITRQPHVSRAIQNTPDNLSNSSVENTYRAHFNKDKTSEELIAADFASCFAMNLAFSLGTQGYNAILLETSCELTFEAGEIINSALSVKAKVKDISDSQFQEIVNDARNNCQTAKFARAPLSVISITLD